MDIKTLPYNTTIGNLIFEAKENELLQVAKEYDMSLDKLKDILNKKLLKSEAKVGACNTAVDFLIVDTINKKKKYTSIERAIADNILASMIYYVNGINKGEYV